MRHILDIDKRRLPSKTEYSEMNAVSAQNYVRKKEGKASRTDYETRTINYHYSNEDLQQSFDGLLKLIEKGMNENSNGFTIYFR